MIDAKFNRYAVFVASATGAIFITAGIAGYHIEYVINGAFITLSAIIADNNEKIKAQIKQLKEQNEKLTPRRDSKGRFTKRVDQCE